MSINWYVARVKPKNEARLQSYLQCYEVPTYLPEIVSFKHGKRSYEYLFPGYMFVRISPTSDLWSLVRWARGLKYFLPTLGEPEPIADSLIENLQAKVKLWNSEGYANVFEPGDRVQVEHGPLRSLAAVFQSYLPSKQRCEILVSLVGRQQNVRLPVSDLRCLVVNHRFADVGT